MKTILGGAEEKRHEESHLTGRSCLYAPPCTHAPRNAEARPLPAGGQCVSYLLTGV